MSSPIKTLKDLLVTTEPELSVPREWELRCIQSDQCMSYIAWNTETQEALAIDPKKEDWAAYEKVIENLPDCRWIGVFDTHTHADHISIAAKLAEHVHAPLIMHALSPSKNPHLRIAKSTTIASQSGKIRIWTTPGHTPDSISIQWGPFLFTGDHILFGDTGRDDLPGGSPADHYDSLVPLKAAIDPQTILLPGHDHKGGRASSWAKQLEINSSLKQNREDFIRESTAFDAPAPELLKASLRENFK